MIRKIMKAGWKTSIKNPGLLTLLFVYQLAWGFFIYRFIQSIVDPLLHRYPNAQSDPLGNYLFWAEGQFRLMKTDAAWSALAMLAAILAVRLIMAPLLEAGIYYTIHYGQSGRKRPFLQGIRKLAKPFSVIYLVRTIAVAAPLIWLAPKWYDQLVSSGSLESLLFESGPWIAGYAAFVGLVKLISMYIQFAFVGENSVLQAMKALVLGCISAIAASLAIGALFLAVMLAASAASLWVAGLVAVIFHQLYHLIRSLFAMWQIGAQYALWNEKQ